MSLLKINNKQYSVISNIFPGECVHIGPRVYMHPHTHTQNTTDQYTWISKQVIHFPRQNSGYKMNKLNMRTI